MKKKIGIVTIESLNYGNRLQNYAMQELIESLGFRAETIQRKKPEPVGQRVKSKIKMCARFCFSTKGAKFYLFDKKIHKSKNWATAYETEKNLSEHYSCFVSGSDQIWNPYYNFVGTTDFLEFAQPDQRIAYAASFGVELIPNTKKEKYAKLLMDYKAISVREKEGIRIVNELTDNTPTLVLDPTLTMDKEKWIKAEKKPKFVSNQESYALVYALGDKSYDFTKAIEEKEQEGLQILDIRNRTRYNKELSIGPSEFLYLIHHANIVLTDSFHATVFSLIYHKSVIVFNRKDLDLSSRIRTLAEVVGLENKIRPNGILYVDMDTDFTQVDQNIKREGQRSVEFLKNALRGIE